MRVWNKMYCELLFLLLSLIKVLEFVMVDLSCSLIIDYFALCGIVVGNALILIQGIFISMDYFAFLRREFVKRNSL